MMLKYTLTRSILDDTEHGIRHRDIRFPGKTLMTGEGGLRYAGGSAGAGGLSG